MSRIDFPSYGDTHTDENGLTWKKINNSWVKQFSYSAEAPAVGGVQYCKLNQLWTPIVFPVAEDDPDDGIIYARQNNTWVPTTANAGPAAPGVDGLLYGLRDGVWDLIPGDDLTENYYNQTISDGRFAAITHEHTLDEISDANAMAAEPDAGAVDDDIQHVRINHAWAPIVLPTVPQHSKAVTIINPEATDDALIFRTPSPITINSVFVATPGDPNTPGAGNFVYNIAHADTADGSGGNVEMLFDVDQMITSDSVRGEAVVVDNPDIPAGHYVWVLVVSVPTPTLPMFHVTLAY